VNKAIEKELSFSKANVKTHQLWLMLGRRWQAFVQ
jgi:hypothetical protein